MPPLNKLTKLAKEILQLGDLQNRRRALLNNPDEIVQRAKREGMTEEDYKKKMQSSFDRDKLKLESMRDLDLAEHKWGNYWEKQPLSRERTEALQSIRRLRNEVEARAPVTPADNERIKRNINDIDAHFENINTQLRLMDDKTGENPQATHLQRVQEQLIADKAQAYEELKGKKPNPPGGQVTAKIRESLPIEVWAGTNQNAQFSNLSNRPFYFKDRPYKSVEHAYQTNKGGRFHQKTYNAYLQPGAARKIRGPKPTGTPQQLTNLMDELVYESFKQNPNMAQQLLNTGDRLFTHNRDRGIWRQAFPDALHKARNKLKGPQQQYAEDMLDVDPYEYEMQSQQRGDEDYAASLAKESKDTEMERIHKAKLTPENIHYIDKDIGEFEDILMKTKDVDELRDWYRALAEDLKTTDAHPVVIRDIRQKMELVEEYGKRLAGKAGFLPATGLGFNLDLDELPQSNSSKSNSSKNELTQDDIPQPGESSKYEAYQQPPYQHQPFQPVGNIPRATWEGAKKIPGLWAELGDTLGQAHRESVAKNHPEKTQPAQADYTMKQIADRIAQVDPDYVPETGGEKFFHEAGQWADLLTPAAALSLYKAGKISKKVYEKALTQAPKMMPKPKPFDEARRTFNKGAAGVGTAAGLGTLAMMRKGAGKAVKPKPPKDMKATPVIRSAVDDLRGRMMSKVELSSPNNSPAMTEEMINVLSPEQMTQRINDLKGELMQITRTKALLESGRTQGTKYGQDFKTEKVIEQLNERKTFLMQQLDELAGAPQTIEGVSAARMQAIEESLRDTPIIDEATKHRMNNPQDIRDITPEEWNQKTTPDDAEFLQEGWNER